MQRFRKILVAVESIHADEAPHSLLRAVKLARSTGAELHVVGVIPQTRFIRGWFLDDTDAEQLTTRRWEEHISSLCEKYADGVEYSCTVRHGRPFIELIQESHAANCDLIIKSADPLGTVPLLGSGDLRLMRNSSLPVWIVKTMSIPVYERVLVALDPFAESAEEIEVNSRLLELASSLADWEQGELYVVSACEIRGAEFLVSSMSQVQFHDHVRDLAIHGKSSLIKMLERLPEPVPQERIEYQDGTPSSVIVNYANEIDADVVVLGTLTKNSVDYLLMGNTASEVLRQVRRSVLTIKPEGFHTPVTPN